MSGAGGSISGALGEGWPGSGVGGASGCGTLGWPGEGGVAGPGGIGGSTGMASVSFAPINAPFPRKFIA